MPQESTMPGFCIGASSLADFAGIGVGADFSIDYGAVHPTYLPDSDKAKGYALLCQAKPLSDVVVEVHELAGVAGIRPRKIPCRVEKIERPAPDVAILNLRLPMNENFRFLAG